MQQDWIDVLLEVRHTLYLSFLVFPKFLLAALIDFVGLFLRKRKCVAGQRVSRKSLAHRAWLFILLSCSIWNHMLINRNDILIMLV